MFKVFKSFISYCVYTYYAYLPRSLFSDVSPLIDRRMCAYEY